MALTTTWEFENFTTKLSENGLSKVIKEYHIQAVVESDVLVATNLDGTSGGNVARVIGKLVQLNSPDSESFVNFDDVTEADLKSWAFSAMGTTEEAFLAPLIAEMTQAEIDFLNPPAAQTTNDKPPLV